MRHTHRVLFCLAAILVVSGCQAASASPIQVRLGEAFNLGVGQSAVITSEPLRLTFDKVLADSRCPKNVACVWTGEARLTVLVELDGGQPAAIIFNTNPAPGQNKQEPKSGPYTIRLVALNPYPEGPAKIQASDYRAVLLVEKG